MPCSTAAFSINQLPHLLQNHKKRKTSILSCGVPSFVADSARIAQVAEMEIPRAQAEKALAEHNGDLLKALRALIVPPGSS